MEKHQQPTVEPAEARRAPGLRSSAVREMPARTPVSASGDAARRSLAAPRLPSSRELLFSSLVRQRVVPLIGASDPHAGVTLCESVVDGHATSDYVRILQFTGDPRHFVVRAKFRLFNPVRPWGRFRRLQQSADLCRLIGQHGIAVPRIECIVSGVDWARWQQYWIGVEEFVEGVELDRSNSHHVLGAFELLGRLHSIRSSRWGRPGVFSGGPASSFAWSALARRTRHQLRKAHQRLPSRLRKQLVEWTAEETAGLLSRLEPEPFSLVHGDFKCSNNLCTPEGKVVAIDFEHTRYWLAGAEFLRSLAHFCAHNGLARQAARVYFDACDGEIARQLREGENLLLLLATVDMLAKKNPARRLSPDRALELLNSHPAGLMADGVDSPWDEVVRHITEFRLFSPEGG